MDKKLMESYLDNIAELVIDEEKIVTYKSLSKSLGIHVNTAKQLLHTYLTKEKSKNSLPISATYLLAGKVKDGSFNISIVNEVNLKSTYSNFVEITSEHVYSIQKGKIVKELKVLCEGTDKDSAKVTSPLVIKCSKSILKFRGELKRKPESWEEKSKKVIEDALISNKDSPSLEEQNKRTETTESNEAGTKSPVKKSPKGNSTKSQAEVKKPTGSIANLFAKVAQKNADKSAKDNNSASKTKQQHSEPTSIPASTTTTAAAEEADVKKTEQKNLERGSRSKESSKREKNGKKRKRIQMLSDSEDSESSVEDTSPVKEDSPVPLAIEEEKDEIKEVVPQNKRKKRKVIDRTVMNEDGYLETKKEVIFETDSENEVDEERKPDEKRSKVVPLKERGKGVQTASAAKKQSSLLSFFKKS